MKIRELPEWVEIRGNWMTCVEYFGVFYVQTLPPDWDGEVRYHWSVNNNHGHYKAGLADTLVEAQVAAQNYYKERAERVVKSLLED